MSRSIHKFLKECLGQVEPVNDIKLPKLLRAHFTSYLFKVEESTIACVEYNVENFSLPNMTTFINKYENEDYELVFVVNELSDYARIKMIENKIPFIELNKQVYLPFLYYFYKKSRKKPKGLVEEHDSTVLSPFSPL